MTDNPYSPAARLAEIKRDLVELGTLEPEAMRELFERGDDKAHDVAANSVQDLHFLCALVDKLVVSAGPDATRMAFQALKDDPDLEDYAKQLASASSERPEQ